MAAPKTETEYTTTKVGDVLNNSTQSLEDIVAALQKATGGLSDTYTKPEYTEVTLSQDYPVIESDIWYAPDKSYAIVTATITCKSGIAGVSGCDRWSENGMDFDHTYWYTPEDTSATTRSS